jgi:4-pyridoxolactonase
MDTARAFLLDTGTPAVDGQLYCNAGAGGEVRFPCYGVLVNHPEGPSPSTRAMSRPASCQ